VGPAAEAAFLLPLLSVSDLSSAAAGALFGVDLKAPVERGF